MKQDAVSTSRALERARIKGWRRVPKFVVTLFAATAFSSATAAIPASERSVLLDLYTQTQGTSWGAGTTWNGAAGTECTWFGVTCDAGQTHVIGISLRGVHLVGTLPAISALTALQTFEVDGPPFGGHVDDEIDAAGQGQLSGPLPSLDGLTNLQTFNASNNQLTGNIPPLGTLASLSYFNVSRNKLSGSIPSFSGLANLTDFEVNGNQLTGSIPDLSSTTKLQWFVAAHNALTGSIPSFSGVRKLDTFEVQYNQLTGSIPSLSGLSNLDTFRVDYNRLTGSIPALTDLVYLYSFNASHNHLSGSIPSFPVSDWPYGVRGFDVGFNLLTGSLPAPPRGYDSSRFTLCPNLLTRTDSSGWDDLAHSYPWYRYCFDAKVNLNQFGLTGSWYNPTTSGQGFLLEGFPDLFGAGQGLFFGSWFTFDQSNNPVQQRWYSLQGNIDNVLPFADLDIYTGLGGNFNAPPRVAPTKVGTATLALSDCAHATLSYSFMDSMPKGTGVIPLTRLSGNTLCAPAGDNGAAASNFLFSGAWYDPNTSGQGLLFDVNPGSNLLFAAWYTYALNGTPTGGQEGQRWFVLQTNQFAPGMNAINGVEIMTTSGGLFDDPAPTTQQRHLGTANIAFQSCTSMTVAYQFTAGENAGKSGTLVLTRIGPPPAGCVVP